ncbi:MAG: PAS domain-containing protein [gamma proteobacterium symbiont of Lucinoma myriamae]|nr:PAS domain-containing protein [gamma proteobacterium symbiont of Lucinoma myriamae]MCU7818985.1 PAS domain-containing protein [gamma proteobacterium symbiont of Lucinoma myriamae]MCU7832753.1 PAS domain-containing protein [gamma proteobacterium symbiont of Lucinoma myriamae]
MKRKIQPTQKELIMRDNDFIVSKTDLKGRITYANKIFIEFGGYSQDELLNTQHNIIRHPDMPRAVFNLLWKTLQAGKEFNDYVKNMSKDGGFYWVFANVTPSYDNNKVIGYYSVRRKAAQQALQIIEPMYKEMLAAEKNAGAKNAIDVATQLLLEKLQGVDYDQFILSI